VAPGPEPEASAASGGGDPHAIRVTPDEFERAFRAGLDAYNGGAFYEAHEHWETCWRAGITPPRERDFYKGLIHATVAFYQVSRANVPAAQKKYRSAMSFLMKYGPSFRGLDVERFMDEFARAFEPVLAYGKVPDGMLAAAPRLHPRK